MFPHTASLLDRFDGVRTTGNGWEARCPCRQDDQNPSCSIHENDDGQILVHCFRSAGACGAIEIVSAVGLTLADLRPSDNRRTDDFDPPSYKQKKSEKLTFVAKYEYLDENKTLLFEKVRFLDSNGKKTFRQRRPDGDDWTYKLGNTPKVLYNLPGVLQAKADGDSIYVVEGEKDCDTLTQKGACATTMPGGAGKWLDLHTEALAGAMVDIILDNDEVGRKHAFHVYEQLVGAGCDVEIFQCPEAKDISDHIEAGGTTSELIKVESETLKSEFAGQETQGKFDETEEDDLPPPTSEELAVERLRELLDDPNKSASQILSRASLLAEVGKADAGLRDEGRLVRWDDFLAEVGQDSYDWLIPGIVERCERVIIVAAEGVGKTMLARQVAICAGLGVHPFTFQQMPKIRTLTVDLENPERIIRRTSKSIVGAAKSMGFESEMSAHLFIKPDGLDLLNAHDRILLEQHIEESQPDLLVMGPLYKAFLDPGGRTSEAIAIEVAKYLDTLRVVYNLTFWLEHHAPLGSSMTSRELRPFGSAVWSRWPEFGLALQPDPTDMGEYTYDVNHFRGARDLRQWPKRMKRGRKFPFEVTEFMDVS